MSETKFGQKLTVEQFVAQKGMKKIFFNGMNLKGSTEPSYYNDSEGKPTTVRRVAIQDEAGNTVAYASKKVAEEFWGGKPLNETPIAFVETTVSRVDPETGDLQENTSWILSHPNNENRTDVSAMFGL